MVNSTGADYAIHDFSRRCVRGACPRFKPGMPLIYIMNIWNTQGFSRWRDPDLNRGHHDFQWWKRPLNEDQWRPAKSK
jgi:hypothetical protein